jgi:hypothetical protein
MSNQLSPNPIQDRIYHAMNEAGNMLSQQEMGDNLEALEASYDLWKQEGIFVSEAGIWVEPVEGARPNLSTGLGYVPGGIDWAIHFTPYYPVGVDEDGDLVAEMVGEPNVDFKNVTMMAGMLGASEYITLVDAGLLPKPDNIVGVTNKSMAGFARRAGLKSVTSLVDEVAIERVIDTDDQSYVSGEMSFDESVRKFRKGSIPKDQLDQAIMHTIEVAAHAKSSGSKNLQQAAISIANELIGCAYGDEIVWASYETFRDGLHGFIDKFGNTIMKFADKELAALDPSTTSHSEHSS